MQQTSEDRIWQARCRTITPMWNPNYGEARGAESTNDFVHKLKVVLKELNESAIWLEIVKRSEMLLPEEIDPLAQECKELCKIIASSLSTVEKHRA